VGGKLVDQVEVDGRMESVRGVIVGNGAEMSSR